jgi:PIN domain nuclease of toxin-antitoxin system
MAMDFWIGVVKQHLDTHVAVWLAAGDERRLKPINKRLLKGHVYISPIAIIEMEVIREIGRLSEPVDRILRVLEGHGVHREDEHLTEMTVHARTLDFTRDPFDRLIAAHAIACNAVLLTADQHLLQRCTCARWD